MLRLLTEAFARNQDIERFVIFDIQKEEVSRSRLSRMFDPMFLRHNVKLVGGLGASGLMIEFANSEAQAWFR